MLTHCRGDDDRDGDGGERDEEGRDIHIPDGALNVHADGGGDSAGRRNGVTSVIAGHRIPEISQAQHAGRDRLEEGVVKGVVKEGVGEDRKIRGRREEDESGERRRKDSMERYRVRYGGRYGFFSFFFFFFFFFFSFFFFFFFFSPLLIPLPTHLDGVLLVE